MQTSFINVNMSHRKAALLFGMMVAALAGTNAHAAPVGVTVDASTTVTGAGPGGNRLINKDLPIFSDDRLKADRTGNAQIILVDKTRIVGPNAQVDIVDYVYDLNKTLSRSRSRQPRERSASSAAIPRPRPTSWSRQAEPSASAADDKRRKRLSRLRR